MKKSLQVLMLVSAIAVTGSSWAISISDATTSSDRNRLSVSEPLAVPGASTELENGAISNGYEMLKGDAKAGLWLLTYNATLQLGGTYKEAELAAEAVVINFMTI